MLQLGGSVQNPMSSHPQIPVQSWIIGSAVDCDIICAQPAVSGHHCRLTRQGNQYWIQDLQSTNGSFVNGTRIEVGQAVPIQPGMHVTLGQRTPMPWPAASPAPAAPAGS